MCDTIVATPAYTKNGKMLFAKNSDRSPNEPQFLQHIPAKDYDLQKTPTLALTYVAVPQVEHTFEITISRPSWMWGAEFGFNEFGLNIGNEAVFTKEKYVKTDGVTGMDMLRLALERCRSAKEALDFLTDFIEKYQQGGNCGYGKKFYYHNSFLIADSSDAYVLETAGKYWVWKKVKDFFAISNCLCLESYDACSAGLVENAIKNGWCKSKADFNFVKCYTEPLFTKFAKGRERRVKAMELLGEGAPDVKKFISILRSHAGKAERGYQEVGSICMHAGGVIGDQTTASYVAEIDGADSVYFVTGASLPCISLFKPYVLGKNEHVAEDGEDKKGVGYWLTHEKMMRYFISGTLLTNEIIEKGRAAENEWIDRFLSARKEDRVAISEDAFEQDERLVLKQLDDARTKQISFTRGGAYYRIFWKNKTKKLYEFIKKENKEK